MSKIYNSFSTFNAKDKQKLDNELIKCLSGEVDSIIINCKNYIRSKIHNYILKTHGQNLIHESRDNDDGTRSLYIWSHKHAIDAFIEKSQKLPHCIQSLIIENASNIKPKTSNTLEISNTPKKTIIEIYYCDKCNANSDILQSLYFPGLLLCNNCINVDIRYFPHKWEPLCY